MEYIFQGRDGVCFLVKLQAFPVVFIRIIRFKYVGFMNVLRLMHMKMLVDFTRICSKPPALKLSIIVKRA